MLVLESDANGGPGWSTSLSIAGDDDQSINSFAGAAPQPFDLCMELAIKMGVLESVEVPDTALTMLPKSLRCGTAIAAVCSPAVHACMEDICIRVPRAA